VHLTRKNGDPFSLVGESFETVPWVRVKFKAHFETLPQIRGEFKTQLCSRSCLALWVTALENSQGESSVQGLFWHCEQLPWKIRAHWSWLHSYQWSWDSFTPVPIRSWSHSCHSEFLWVSQSWCFPLGHCMHFAELQSALLLPPQQLQKETMFAYPNFDKPFQFCADASHCQSGAVAFCSRELNPPQTQHTTAEREALSAEMLSRNVETCSLDNKLKCSLITRIWCTNTSTHRESCNGNSSQKSLILNWHTSRARTTLSLMLSADQTWQKESSLPKHLLMN